VARGQERNYERCEAIPENVRSAVSTKEDEMRAVLLWAVGIPIPVIILLYLFHVV